MENIIEVNNLVKKYGDFTAVDHISFAVQEGEVFGILGPNGAGKTTTLEMVEGLKAITSGQAYLDGHDVSIDTRLVKSIIGVQLQSSSFFDGLNLVELLETFGALYDRKIDGMELLREVQLEEKAKSQVKELSGGQKQRFSIAAALVNDPKVLFLDEPTTGLDPQARRNLWELISSINKRGKTVVLTTHYMDEAEVLCDRIAIMDNANIVALDTTKNLLSQTGLNSTIHFRISGSPCSVEHLKALTGVEDVASEDHSYRITSNEPQETLPELFEHAKDCGFKMLDLQLHQPTLEDVFLKLTGHALRD
ncbi:MAG TPA: ABC transporter ATP-binding protein [Patescibacteria group bacterium]|jgi:ABC-2 type transport system ATP-binding protein|nr:ABC transporter ATP-binding protein [Patescibacteria group bacterium]